MSTIILKSERGKRVSVPVPEGWTVEDATTLLRKMGHEPTHLEDAKGCKTPIPKAKAA